jgi:hypothetical protein
MRSVLCLAIAALALSSPAFAQADLTRASRGYTYFHYRGVDIGVHDEAVRACIEVTSHTAQSDVQAGQQLGVAGAVLTPILVGPIVKGLNTNADAANIENCMVVQGWAVVSLPPAEGAALAKLEPAAQHAALAPWVGADQPHGTVVRRFGNDLVHGATDYSGRPGDLDKLSLSVTSVGQMPDPQRPRVSRSDYYMLVRDGGIGEPVPASAAGALGPDEALIVIRTTSAGETELWGLHFEKMTDDQSDRAYRFGVYQPVTTIWQKKTEELYVFRVPAGRYRMDKIRAKHGIMSTLSLCLGSPGFDIAAGEVIFAGNIGFTGDGRFVPTMDVAPVQQMLTAYPGLAERLKPAGWMNGTAALCEQDSYLYALEIPGRPTADASSKP